MTSSGASAVAVEYVAGILWYQLAAVAPRNRLAQMTDGNNQYFVAVCGVRVAPVAAINTLAGFIYIHTCA